MANQLFDANDVAALLNVPVSWVREHTRNNHLPHIKLGRYIRYRPEAVIEYVAAQEAGGDPWRKHRPGLKQRPKLACATATSSNR